MENGVSLLNAIIISLFITFILRLFRVIRTIQIGVIT